MKARKISYGYYEITEGGKWWTAMKLTGPSWLITNSQGRVVKRDGALGLRILAAIEVAS